MHSTFLYTVHKLRTNFRATPKSKFDVQETLEMSKSITNKQKQSNNKYLSTEPLDREKRFMRITTKNTIVNANVASSNESEIILNTPNRNEILKEGPPEHFNCNILGRGAFGTVFKAVFEAKQVAVKIVNTLKDVNLQSMRNEAHVLGWKHRNIVRILKTESTSTFGIVIMERFAGQCLQIILDSIELSLVHRVFISLDVLSALTFCHRRNLLHLDVKPQNILVAFGNTQTQYFQQATRNYICKLCDFGSSMKLVKHQNNITRGAAKGTVRYMAPEALCEEPLTSAADFYSLGITMWQLQHRKIPYHWIQSNEVVAYQVVKNNIRPDSDAPLVSFLSPQKVHESWHRNCLCEYFSSEISHRSVKHINHLLSHTENLGFTKSTADDCRPRKLCKPREISKNFPKTEGLRVPFRNLNSQVYSNQSRDLYSEFDSKLCMKTMQTRGIHGDCCLESVFRQSYMYQSSKERSFEMLYKSCWHSDLQRRPDAIELRRKFEEFL